MSMTYSFTKIFNTPVPYSSESDLVSISKVVVPRIQRPYAQGRNGESETRIRDSFLKEIFKSLKKGIVLDMNFVYGAVRKRKENNKIEYIMELLDGQQRFTTLYLLHWYLLNKENKEEDPSYESVRVALRSFSYETRTTATQFCKSLADYVCNFEDEKPSERIKNARWYYHAYDKDSTISGMLVMLDAIDRYYKNYEIEEGISKVDNLQFYVLPLMQFGKSEDLYMKMNARGLPLSVFDSFKADFTGAMNKVISLREEMVQLEGGLAHEFVSHIENISIKLDAKWIDLFWDEGGKRDSDISYMRFFSRFFACRYLIDSPRPPKEMRSSDVSVNLFYTQSEKSKGEYLGFDEYAVELEQHPDYFTAVEKVLDTIQNHKNVIQKSLVPVWDTEFKGNFLIDANVPFTQTLLTLMGAIEEFILTFNNFDETLYEKWMRIVWNIVENTDIDNLERVATTLRNFGRMIRSVANALDCESKFGIARESVHDVTKTNSFYRAVANCALLPFPEDEVRWSRAFKEEIEKAKRISEDDMWLEQFKLMEKHPYFRGTINFYYTEGMTLDKFKHRCELVANMFDSSGISQEYRHDHILLRALLSQLSTWKDIEKQHITEDSETHKFLKILLTGNQNIHLMLSDILDTSNNNSEVIAQLEEKTEELIPYEGKSGWDLQVAIACNTLRTDIKLYEWMLSQPYPVYVHMKNGHIAVAIPGKWYDRFFIDSDRDKMAQEFISDYGMQYYPDKEFHTTSNDFEKYHRYKGENAIFYLSYDNNDDYTLNIEFSNNHRFRIFIQMKSKNETQQFLNLVGVGYMDDNPYRVYLDHDDKGDNLHYYLSSDYTLLRKYVDNALSISRTILGQMGVLDMENAN